MPANRITKLIKILRTAKNQSSVSDLHIIQGEKPWIRVDGILEIWNMKIDGKDVKIESDDIMEFISDNIQENNNLKKSLDADNYVSTAIHSDEYGDIRVHIQLIEFKHRLIIRLLNAEVPDLVKLNLPEIISTFANFSNGLVLFTGATGSGKSTALAALINEINKKYNKAIYTLEDPIEYRHKSLKSLVTQMSVGTDVRDYAAGIRSLLRSDPDVILVGEMRDPETMLAAIVAAETGHLVFSTMHDNGVIETCQRIIGAFGGDRQEQIKMSFASVLRAAVSLRLIKSTSEGRIPACEIMINNEAIRNHLRRGEFVPMLGTIEGSGKEGMQMLEKDLTRLVHEGRISLQDAREAANRPDQVKAKPGE